MKGGSGRGRLAEIATLRVEFVIVTTSRSNRPATPSGYRGSRRYSPAPRPRSARVTSMWRGISICV